MPLLRPVPPLLLLATLGCGGDDLLLPADGGQGGVGGAPSASQSTISADPDTVSAGTGTSTITVTVLDDRGNPVPGASVALAASGVSNTLTQPSGPSGTDGTVRGAVAAGPDVGTIVVTAVVSESVEVSQAAQVTVTASGSHVNHFVFRLQPPHDVKVGEHFRIEAALADTEGNVVPLMGILMYIALFPVGSDVPNNHLLEGNRFVATDSGVAVFDSLAVTRKGHYRFRVLSDQLPELGPHGPEPYLFSLPFEVK